jgi:hypothetical protein
VKDLSEFYRVTGGRYGKDSRCADCVRAYQGAYRDRNRGRIRQTIKSCARKQRATLEGYLAHAARNKRKNAAKIGVSCEITAKDLLELYRAQKGRCKLSGATLRWGAELASADTLSIDRIDPSIGYVRSNIRLVTVRANRARGQATEEEWREFVDALIRWRAQTDVSEL